MKSSPLFTVFINLEDPISKYSGNFYNMPFSVLLEIQLFRVKLNKVQPGTNDNRNYQ